ncbi:MAG: 30S ribosomal protein S20 [Hyphomonadaceae bacterium]
MANTSSAEKAIRRDARRTEVNKARRSRVRTFWKKLEDALSAGDAAAAQTAFRTAEAEAMRAVSKGVTPKNQAARKVSRLAKRVKALSGQSRPA